MSGMKKMTGTSFSTPIAAGVAALVLEFSRQSPLSLDPNINFKLRDIDVMRSILHTFCSEKKEGSRGFRFLCPWLNLSGGDHASRPYGGDANDPGSLRFKCQVRLLGICENGWTQILQQQCTINYSLLSQMSLIISSDERD